MTNGEVVSLIAPVLHVEPEDIGSFLIIVATGDPVIDPGFSIKTDGRCETKDVIARLCNVIKYLADPAAPRSHPDRADPDALFRVCEGCGREIEL